jgi:hypothetical protein
MSYKTTFSIYSKSFTEKKILDNKKTSSKNISYKNYHELFNQNLSPFNLYTITYKNLKKYSTSNKKYRVFIINSIIFDQRIHKVAVFKNNLLWDESSDFLKRFYKNKESIERIPKISEYYEKYTLFPPVYFGLNGLIVITMNKWTKRKKNYLEYIEDQEDEREERKKKNKNKSFEKLINSSLINNKTPSKSILSINTLDLSKLELESNKKNTVKSYVKKNNQNFKTVNKENSLSLSDIIDDLSSQYSIIYNNDNNNKNNVNNSIKDKEKKNKKILHINLNKRYMKKEGRNEINVNKIKNNFYYNTKSLTSNSKINSINMTKSQTKSIESPKKTIKICLNKKNTKYILTNNNPNIIKRNSNNLPLPSESKKFQKKLMNTDNNINKNNGFPGNRTIIPKTNNKGTIRVNTLTSYIIEKNKILNSNLIQRSNKSIKDEIISSKKLNYIKNNNIKKNLIYSNKKDYSDINNGKTLNFVERNSYNKTNNMIRDKNFIKIKRKSLIDNNYSCNNYTTQKPLTYRDISNQINYLYEKPSSQNLKRNIIINKKKNNCIKNSDANSKNARNIEKNDKNLYLEDPFIYKLTQLTKKRQISFTSTNSFSRIKNVKNFTHYGISSILDTNHYDSKYNTNTSKLNKIKNKKNLVLTKLNSLNMESKLLRDDIRNNSTSLHKNNNNSMNLNSQNKISNSHSYKPKNSNSKNINLNLNLNIHFNIDIENKKKGKKILLNKAIITQMQNRYNKSHKYSREYQNKENNNQGPLTSRNSERALRDL